MVVSYIMYIQYREEARVIACLTVHVLQISECLGHPWRPLPESALANAVRDPDADAEEQYIDLLLKSQEY